MIKENIVKDNYEYFKTHFDEIYSQYPEMHVILKDQKIIAAYQTLKEAIDETAKTEKLGEFSIQLCSKDESRMVHHFYSGNVVFN